MTITMGTIITANGTKLWLTYQVFFHRMWPVDFSTWRMSWLKSRISSRCMLIWPFTFLIAA